MAEDDLSSLIGKYYRKSIPDEQHKFERGQIYYCPIFYSQEKIDLLDLKYVDPADKNPPIFEIRSANKDAFSDRLHKPLVKPRLNIDEEIVAVKAKRRKVIVLSSNTERWLLREGKPRDECYLVLPMFSFHEGDDVEWKLRLGAYAYKELFYLPEETSLRLTEGYIRFDRAQSVPSAWLDSAGGICLTREALNVLTGWFQFYLTSVANDDIRILLEYREAALKQIDGMFGRSAKL